MDNTKDICESTEKAFHVKNSRRGQKEQNKNIIYNSVGLCGEDLHNINFRSV